MQCLRQSTGGQHKEAERRVKLGNVVDGESLRHLLERLWGFYRPVECSLSSLRWHLAQIDFLSRRKTSWLEEDLVCLSSNIHQLPQSPPFPIPHSLEEGIGCLYVLEGATLGGKFILTQLATKGLRGPTGCRCRFYSGYGDKTGEMWTEFKVAAASYCREESQIDQAILGATRTFDRFLLSLA